MGRPPAPKTRIQRSGNGHMYFLDGEKVPGVTTILGDGIPKPGLLKWASEAVSDFVVNRLVVATTPDGRRRIVADDVVTDALAWNETRERRTPVSASDVLPRQALGEILTNIRYRDLDEASGKGTQVHNLAERLAHGEEVDVPNLLVGHVDAYLRFLEEWEPYDVLTERVIVNRKWRYMGKLDLIAWFAKLPEQITAWIDHPPPYRGLLDIKTSRSGIYAETALQLEAYRHGETMLEGADEVPMPAVDFVAAIHVRTDGYAVYAFDTNRAPRPTPFEIFLYAKQVGQWLDWKTGPAATIKTDALPAPHPKET